jgi:hypothetical protein
MPDQVLRHMANGAGIKELAHYLRVSRQTVYDWCDPKSKQYHRPFAQAVELGRELCEAWWMRYGRLAMMGKVAHGPPAFWIFNMKNRFGWRDRVEIAGTEDAPLTVTLKNYEPAVKPHLEIVK